MFCHQCGAQLADDLAFCTNCGTKLAQEEDIQVVETEQPVVIGSYTPSDEATNYIQSGNVNTYAEAENTYTPPQNYQQDIAYTSQERKGSPKKVSFGGAIKLYFANYVNFSGRSTLSEYWWAYLFNTLVCGVLSFIPYIGTFLTLAFFLPSLSLIVRRLHDIGKSWTYLFMGLIPFAGAIILLINFCKRSDGDNRWGPAAKN